MKKSKHRAETEDLHGEIVKRGLGIPSSRSVSADFETDSRFLKSALFVSTCCRHKKCPAPFGVGHSSLSKKPRRVFRSEAKKRSNPFFPGTCASGKTLLSSEVCELSAKVGQRVRTRSCIPSVKKVQRTFLTVSARPRLRTRPQAVDKVSTA